MARKRNRREAFPTVITLADEPCTPERMAKRGRNSVDPALAENFRKRLKWHLENEFGGNMTSMSKRVKVSRSAISQVLNHINSPGEPSIAGLASYLRCTRDEVLAPFSPPAVDRSAHAESGVQTEGTTQDMGDLVQLPSATAHARYPHLESAIAFYAYEKPPRWSRLVIAHAREGYFEDAGCEQWTPPEWAKRLDEVETALRQAKPGLPAATAPKLLGPHVPPAAPSSVPPRPRSGRKSSR